MKALWMAALLFASGAAMAAPFTLSAKAGQFQSVVGEDVAASGEVDATIRITSTSAGHKWAPGAYLGFSQESGQYPQNGIQFFLVRNEPADRFLIVGYRIIKDGAVAESAPLSRSKVLSSSITFRIHFNKGTFLVSVNGSSPATVITNLNKVHSTFSVSSCIAEFSNIYVHLPLDENHERTEHG